MLQRASLIFAFALFVLFSTGCFDSAVDEQSVPWGRPADWEGGAPGFGGY